jgi:hypothetical protein
MGAHPLDDVVSILFFIAVGLELTFGGVSTSNVDEKDEITASRGLDGKLGLGRVVLLAVGGSIDDRRKAPDRVGAKKRRPELDAIAQRDLDPPLDDDVRIGFECHRLRKSRYWRGCFRSRARNRLE